MLSSVLFVPALQGLVSLVLTGLPRMGAEVAGSNSGSQSSNLVTFLISASQTQDGLPRRGVGTLVPSLTSWIIPLQGGLSVSAKPGEVRGAPQREIRRLLSKQRQSSRRPSLAETKPISFPWPQHGHMDPVNVMAVGLYLVLGDVKVGCFRFSFLMSCC